MPHNNRKSKPLTTNQTTIAPINPPSSPPVDPYKIYFTQKQIALLLEKINLSRIIVFPSVSKEPQQEQFQQLQQDQPQPEWYKIGGNSAYFYKYYVAPRLHKKPPTIHPDTDLNFRFKDGIISIHWIDQFIQKMASLGYAYKQESDLYIFELNHVFTFREVDALKKQERNDKQRLNSLFRPKHPHPNLYGIILELSKLIPAKAKKLKDGFHHDFAPELNHHVIAIAQYYCKYANGCIDKITAKTHLKSELSDLNATLLILAENNCLDTTSQYRIGRLLNDLSNNIERNFHE